LIRGSTVVCIPAIGNADALRACLQSVLKHTPEHVPVLIAADGDGTESIERLRSDLERQVHHVPAWSAGSVASAAAELAASNEADVVLLTSYASVPAGWFERICDAGRSDTTIATVANGHGVWIARPAIELARPLDEAFNSLFASVVDFSQRCLARGLLNVVDGGVSVSPSWEDSAEGGLLPGSRGDRALLRRRYPYLEAALSEPAPSAVPVSLSPSGPSGRTSSVTIDARIVRGSYSGTHAETLELIEALARTERVKVRAVLDPGVSADALEVLDRAPAVERVYANDIGDGIERTDVVHRPYQVTSVEDLELLAMLGERVVITHLDLIAYHNPSYFDSFEKWDYHRRVTRHALAMADRLIFLSEHAARDAIREQLVERDRISVLAPAVNRERVLPERRRPDGAPSAPFLLQIGNDFRHKNRLFSIKLLEELGDRGWQGELVLAGANVGAGSSRNEEAAYLESRPELAPLVHDFPPVDEAEKAWLYANAAAISYPSAYEGFGLIPFEAAQAGKPCLFAPQASLAEVLPPEAAVLVPWDVHASAERALPLLREGDERNRQVDLVLGAASRMGDWTSLGGALLKLYDETASTPQRRLTQLPRPAPAKKAGGPLARMATLAQRVSAKVRGSR
jgi:glycosyltransferase involved in cell wall biosynthesis